MNTLNKTKYLMNKYNINPTKKFGQNFLIDDNILQNIVDASNITEDDIVIEIGPGLGNLTQYLIEKAKFVILIEIDNSMIGLLEDRFKEYQNYKILNQDILKINLDELTREYNSSNIKVVANLPYYITTPILFKLLQESSDIKEITVMVQKEVAKRMVAPCKTKDYGILTLMVEYLAIPEIKFFVPNSSFIPSPNVESAIINLKKEKRYNVKDENILFDLIHSAFAMRRKKMINSLEQAHFLNMNKEDIKKFVNICGLTDNVRAEELSINEYIKLADKISEIKNK